MTAGQEVVLTGEDQQSLTTLRMGLGWDKERTAGAIGTGAPDVDLDASAVQFSGDQLFDQPRLPLDAGTFSALAEAAPREPVSPP